MSQIIDPATGKYAPEVPARESVPIVKPKQLPQNQGDLFEKVDIHAYDKAAQMTTAQLSQMGVVAEYRKDAEASMFWKGQALEALRRESEGEAQVAAKNRMQPQAVPAPGSQIVTNQGASPWEQDPEYRQLVIETEKAVVAAQNVTGTDEKLAANQAVAAAQERLRNRQAVVRQEAIVSGHWSEQDDRTLEARSGMAAKAAKVEAQAKAGQ